MLFEYDANGSATLVVRPEGNSVLHHDYLGNVILVEEAATGVTKEVHYLPYG